MKLLNVNQEITKNLNFQLLPFDPHGWLGGSAEWTRIINDLKPRRVVEVGAWMGLTTRYLATFPFINEIICVDHWDAKQIDSNSIDMSLQPANRVETMYEQFLSNCIHAGIASKVYPIRATSHIGANICADIDMDFDMIWIDADHMEHSVLIDIDAWLPRLAKGGLFCGDDYPVQGVKNAVDAKAKQYGFEVYSNGNYWQFK